MDAKDMLRVCLKCQRVAEYGSDDWRVPTAKDRAHPARSHGYCSDECVLTHYPATKL